MDVSKFTLDRNAYLNTAAAIYESTKQQVSSNYSAYLDPSVLTNVYSKMYSDRAASAASNYAFDITKIYGNQGGSQDMSADRDSTPQLDDSNKNNMGDAHMDFNNGVAANYQSFNQQPIKFETEQSNTQAQQQHGTSSSGSGSSQDYRRPLTVIF